MAGAVLITGGRGFVGSYLRRELGARAVVTRADVTDAEAVAEAVRDAHPVAVIHLAAYSSVGASWENPRAAWEVNAIGTVNVLDAVRRHQPETRTLVVSTGEVYGNADQIPTSESAPVAPLSPYATAKAAAELETERARRTVGLDIVIVRPFPHIGPGQAERFAVGSWTRQIARLEHLGGGTLYVGDVSAKRDVTDVRDVVRAYRLLLDPSVRAGTYNVASGRCPPMKALLEELLSRARCQIAVEVDERRLRHADVPVLCGDHSLLSTATGWRPRIPLERTLTETLEHARRTVREEVTQR
ncbi:MAG TPA: GDP-mannose 4,6-dehydratase [Gaiellaceae bacterium]|nr:GDP-mannose 4,6-dehydratase [Gaiellaceae bacterium]